MIAGMTIGNVIPLILHWPLVDFFAKLADLPAAPLFPMMLTVSAIGVYSVRLASLICCS